MLQLHPLRLNRTAAERARGLAGWRVKRVTAFVEANIGSSIRVGELARMVLLSTSHFCRAFKQTFGETPLRYVMRQRMRRAQAIMLCSRDSLAKIAVDCGMCDQAHFCRVFRRIVGVNPGAWRRRVRALGASRRGESTGPWQMPDIAGTIGVSAHYHGHWGQPPPK